ncbi:hypothetical protein [Collimonas silvisoli]|uniref:hypothetical protein n=1 Tax=Collimonas silvisoli TaxID=2825884 RepID=UPI001B8C9422|nr:hypothetical protein [Collimonas silvisoli]
MTGITDNTQPHEEESAWEGGSKPRASLTAIPQTSWEAVEDAGAVDAKINAIVSKAAETIEQLHYRQDKIIAARNPLYQAAKPLLRTLADLPTTQLHERNSCDSNIY